jgi:uncharacterized protein YcfJ
MVSGGTRGVLLAGVIIGTVIVGWIAGAAIDFVTGNQGWWGVGALAGLMVGTLVDTRLVEDRSRAVRPH